MKYTIRGVRWNVECFYLHWYLKKVKKMVRNLRPKK